MMLVAFGLMFVVNKKKPTLLVVFIGYLVLLG